MISFIRQGSVPGRNPLPVALAHEYEGEQDVKGRLTAAAAVVLFALAAPAGAQYYYPAPAWGGAWCPPAPGYGMAMGPQYAPYPYSMQQPRMNPVQIWGPLSALPSKFTPT